MAWWQGPTLEVEMLALGIRGAMAEGQIQRGHVSRQGGLIQYEVSRRGLSQATLCSSSCLSSLPPGPALSKYPAGSEESANVIPLR